MEINFINIISGVFAVIALSISLLVLINVRRNKKASEKLLDNMATERKLKTMKDDLMDFEITPIRKKIEGFSFQKDLHIEFWIESQSKMVKRSHIFQDFESYKVDGGKLIVESRYKKSINGFTWFDDYPNWDILSSYSYPKHINAHTIPVNQVISATIKKTIKDEKVI